MALYISTKVHEHISGVSKLLSVYDFQTEIFQGIQFSKMLVELWFFFSDLHLIMLYICTKFCENILKGLGVIVRTLFPL